MSSSLYGDLMSEGKKLAAEGKLYESLSKFEHARKIQETPKVLQRIQRLKEFIQQHKNKNEESRVQKGGKTKDSLEKQKTPSKQLKNHDVLHETQKVEKTNDSPLQAKTISEQHKNHDVLQEIQNVTEVIELPDNPSELSPSNLNEFNKLKKTAMSFSYEGRFQDALNTFQKSLKLCNCPLVKKYIKDIKIMIAKHDSELLEFRQLTYSGKKLAQDGKQNLSVQKLKEAYEICPSPKISKILKTLDDQNNSSERSSISKKLFINSDSTNEFDSVRVENSPDEKPAFKLSEESDRTSESSVQIASSESDVLSPVALCRFNDLYKKARSDASEGRLQEALSALKEASSICKTDKILKRIKDIENILKDSADDGDDQMVAVADGFYIFHGIYEKLYPYQRLGVSWMYDLFKKRKGGVLGDDMGLGKTFQVIAFLSGLIDADLVKHILIIMPVSLLTNWEREFAKWCPGIKVYLFHGSSKKERERNILKVKRKGHVLLTSYGMVVSNLDSLAHMEGERFIWDYVILDEGHKIKNPTKTTKAVHEIPAKNRLVLTGTPIQNNLRELWALYDFVHQGALLGSMKTFKMQYENIITRSREKDATAGEKRLGTEMAENLKKLIQPYFLRRTKAEIWDNEKADVNDIECKMADLRISNNSNKVTTRKNDFIIWLPMSDQQCEIYRNFLHSEVVKNILVSKRSPLVELTTLKKICDHPRLLSQRACLQLGLNGELDEEDLMRELDDEATTASSIENVADETLIIESGKMKFLISLLENLKENGHRTLVFSLSRKILDMIHRILLNRQWKVVRIDGTISKTEERERRIQLFQKNSSYPVFLLTTQVGGVGITLTAADRVVIYDPSWNPATDAQAVDRAYRIGQTKNVVIYRLMTCGTVEEKIYRRQIFKDSITRQATGSSDPYRYFSKQELRELFVLDNPNYSATQEQLSQMHSGERKTDCSLDEHIAFLHSLDIFGISDHDLMFSKNIKDDTEDNDESAISHDYIKKQVAAAQERIQAEAAVVEDGLRLAGRYTRPYTENIPSFKNNTERDTYKAPSFPDIDLTQESPVKSQSIHRSDDDEESDNISSSVTPKEGIKFCQVQSSKKKDNLKYKPLNLEKNKITDYYSPDSLPETPNTSSPKGTPTKDYSVENFETPSESIKELIAKEKKHSHFERTDFNSSNVSEGSDSIIYEGTRTFSNSPGSMQHSMKGNSLNDNLLIDMDTVGEVSSNAGEVNMFEGSPADHLNVVKESLNNTGKSNMLYENLSEELETVGENKIRKYDALKDSPSDSLDAVVENWNDSEKSNVSRDNLSYNLEEDTLKKSLNETGKVDRLKDSISDDLDSVEENLNHSEKSNVVYLSDNLDTLEKSLSETRKVEGSKDSPSDDLDTVEENLNHSEKSDVSNDNLSDDLDTLGKSLLHTEKTDTTRDSLSDDLDVTEELEHNFSNELSITKENLNESRTSDLDVQCGSYESKNDHSLSNIMNHDEDLETSTSSLPTKENSPHTAERDVSYNVLSNSLKKEHFSLSVKEEKFSPETSEAINEQYHPLNENNSPKSTDLRKISLNSNNRDLQGGRFSYSGLPSRVKNLESTTKQTMSTSLLHHLSKNSLSFVDNQGDPNLNSERRHSEGAHDDSSEISDSPTVNKFESRKSDSSNHHPQDMSAIYRTSSPVGKKISQDLTLFLNESLNDLSFIKSNTTLKKRKSCARNMHLPSESDSSQPGSSCATPERIVSESEEEVSDDPENSVASIPLSIPSTPVASKGGRSPRITPLRLYGNYISPKNSPFAKALATSPLIQVDATPAESLHYDDSPVQRKNVTKKNMVLDSEDEESSPVLSFNRNQLNDSSSNESSEESECFVTPKSKPNSIIYSSRKKLFKTYFNDSFSD